MTTKRQKENRRKWQKKKRVRLLKEKYYKSESVKEREHLLDLILRRDPWFKPDKIK